MACLDEAQRGVEVCPQVCKMIRFDMDENCAIHPDAGFDGIFWIEFIVSFNGVKDGLGLVSCIDSDFCAKV